ncbi:hypothetical protein U3516DRAFT_847649 [Neocallimastix sp. 'constans']
MDFKNNSLFNKELSRLNSLFHAATCPHNSLICEELTKHTINYLVSNTIPNIDVIQSYININNCKYPLIEALDILYISNLNIHNYHHNIILKNASIVSNELTSASKKTSSEHSSIEDNEQQSIKDYSPQKHITSYKLAFDKVVIKVEKMLDLVYVFYNYDISKFQHTMLLNFNNEIYIKSFVKDTTIENLLFMNKYNDEIFSKYYHNYDVNAIEKIHIDILKSIYNNVIYIPYYNIYIYNDKVIIKNYNISVSVSNITYKFADILSYINNTKEFLQQINISASIISYTNLSLTINLDTYIDPLISNYMIISAKLFYQIKFNEFNNLVYNSNKHIYEITVEGYKFSMSINDKIITCNNILFSNTVYILNFVNRILCLYIRTYQANKFNFKDNNIIELNGFNGYKTIDLLYYSRYFTNYDNILPEEISVNDLSYNTYVVYNNRYYRAPLKN